MSAQCRFCGSPGLLSIADLGMSPLANSYLKQEHLSRVERFYPLHALFCERCFLVQLEEFETPEHIFTDYSYFSSFSESWLRHAQSYVENIVERFQYNESSFVVEIASNDGYLLQYFLQRNIPVLGIEPAVNVAQEARRKGVPTLVKFFGTETAQELASQDRRADLIVANNVLAHVPDLNDFARGLSILLKHGGIVTIEFPHLLRLISERQFDTIYHEHFSYFSFAVAERVLAAHGMRVFDVEEIPTHGGSLRVFGCHRTCDTLQTSARVKELRSTEQSAGLQNPGAYRAFADCVKAAKRSFMRFLIDAKEAGKHVAGYGAPAKASTLLNYCGIRTDLLEYTVDRSPHKQGRYLPGVHVPILEPSRILETKPDYVVIFPWNIKDEIMDQMAFIRTWNGKFVVAIPQVQVFD